MESTLSETENRYSLQLYGYQAQVRAPKNLINLTLTVAGSLQFFSVALVHFSDQK